MPFPGSPGKDAMRTQTGQGSSRRSPSDGRKGKTSSKEAKKSPAKGERRSIFNIFKRKPPNNSSQEPPMKGSDTSNSRRKPPVKDSGTSPTVRKWTKVESEPNIVSDRQPSGRPDPQSTEDRKAGMSDQRRRHNILRLAVGAEFIGTFIHVLLGLGIECLCRVVSTDSTLSEDYLPKLGWGLSWTAAFCVAGGISGGHFNGTVSFALFLAGYISIFTMLLYWLVQALGALLAGLVIYSLYYWPLDRRFGLDDSNHLFVGSAFGGAVRENVAAPFFWSLAASFLCAFVLVLTVFFITDQKNMHVPRPMYGLLIGLLCYTPVLLITSFFYYGCAIINFPVDAVTRIYTLFSWKNDYLNAMGGWIGCLLGAVFAFIIDFAIHRYDSLRPRRLNAPVGGPRKSDVRIRK